MNRSPGEFTADGPPTTTERDRRPRRPTLAHLALALAVLPIAVAVVRSIIDGYIPLGDNGFLLIRSRDVLTSNNPLLGTWSSSSLTTGLNVNNPGPLLWDLLALPTKVLGAGPGLAVGAAAINVGAIVGAWFIARRQAGTIGAVTTMLFATVVGWSMGSALLFDPWQPHQLILPFLCFTMLCWGIANGDVVAAPWAVGIGSLLLQTHLSYVYLVPWLLVVSIAVLLLDQRRTREDPPTAVWLARRRWTARVTWISVAVLVVLWAQTAYEQFFGVGEGNVSRLLSSTSSDEPKIGLKLGVRLMASVVSLPPWFGRGSFDQAIPNTPYLDNDGSRVLQPLDVAGFAVAAVSLFLVAAVVGAVGWWAYRRRDRPAFALVVVAGATLLGGVATVTVMPLGVLGLTPHQMRWLWPMGALLATAVVVTCIRLTPRVPAAFRGRAPVILVALTTVAALLNLPIDEQRAGPVADSWARPTAEALLDQLGSLSGRGTILFDPTGLRFAEPFSSPVLAELQDREITFVVDDEVLVRQLGEGRRSHGEASGSIVVVEGNDASIDRPGSERVAYVEGLDADERAEVAALAEQLTLSVDLTEDPLTMALSGELGTRISSGEIVVAAADQPSLARMNELLEHWFRETVAVFYTPFAA